jgi:hypothetical protein
VSPRRRARADSPLGTGSNPGPIADLATAQVQAARRVPGFVTLRLRSRHAFSCY